MKTALTQARADAARALALLDGLTVVEGPRTVVTPIVAMTTEEITERQTVPMGDSWYSTTVDDDAALAAASSEIRAVAAVSPTGRVDGETVAAVYRRHGVWR